ncbi:MarR family transcriptional regulator [Pseudoxanthomonas broegbernensis]|uniref:MarR family transcriptional regulator n=1 Tax=Pseudoxanthomonas broegbernensis TaxID=83619 RepID=A0A7V8K7M2_9GAMM|nr:MarR family transcriptional regulator [Pseudoxanthomonas broegbernensis]KAF1686657.1 MarR family transcriptional regulator [Pseudoxanthomonas broegbernensis]MBB6063586.1 DNA-binding MarR family transcriptional regulator [Pseudoxanthomonas broegbernensis]
MVAKNKPSDERESSAEAALVDDVDARAVQALIGFRLRMAQVAVFRDFVETLRPLDLRPSHYAALKLIATNPGLRQQRLGETLEIKRPNLVLLVADLKRRGWLERRRSRSDMRSYALHLTAKGSDLVAAADAAHEVHEGRLRRLLGKDLERFCRALDLIRIDLTGGRARRGATGNSSATRAAP